MFHRTLTLQDNRSLKEQNDELNGQIINLSIQGAKNLMSASFSDSLAAEINNVSRVEVGCNRRGGVTLFWLFTPLSRLRLCF